MLDPLGEVHRGVRPEGGQQKPGTDDFRQAGPSVVSGPTSGLVRPCDK